MGDTSTAAAALDVELAAFIQSGVSIVVAGRNDELVGDVIRGCGCRVSADRQRVTVLVDPMRSDALLHDITSNGMIAVVFSRPSTHRSIQLKGTDARRARVTAADQAAIDRSLAAWVAELVSIGYSAEFAAAVRGHPERPVAIAFTPTAGFQQTPGPDAGTRLPA